MLTTNKKPVVVTQKIEKGIKSIPLQKKRINKEIQ